MKILSTLVLFFLTNLAYAQEFCTAEAGQLINPNTGECVGFTNGCDKSDLMDAGYTYLKLGEKCNETPKLEASWQTIVDLAPGSVAAQSVLNTVKMLEDKNYSLIEDKVESVVSLKTNPREYKITREYRFIESGLRIEVDVVFDDRAVYPWIKEVKLIPTVYAIAM